MISLPFVLRYGSDRHTKIVEALNARKRACWNNPHVATKRTRWSKDEERHIAYIPTKEEDQLRKNARNAGEPQYTTLQIPYSYGLLMAAHTYMASVFLSRTPVLQYEERHGQTPQGKQHVEALMDYQTHIGGHMIPYYIWLLDAKKYGVGVVGHYWDTEIVRASTIVDEPVTFFGMPVMGQTRKVKKHVEIPGYVGNRLYNIRPADFIWDTRVALSNFQSGEFAGRYFELSWIEMVEGRHEGQYFNVDVARKMIKQRDAQRDYGSPQLTLPSIEEQEQLETPDIKSTGTAPAYELVVNLIPKDWQLGDSTLPEKWVFTVVAERVIIGARPLGEFHNKFPYSVIEGEIDGYQLTKRSMYQIIDPLSDALNWLVNQHFFNVRKSLNNMFVYDPLRVNDKDFKNPEAGLGIRLKPAAYGTNIDQVIKQFQVQDVTRSHITDTNVFIQLMQQVLGVNEQIMGQMARSGRRTAQEIRSSTGFSINRLKTEAEYMSAMGWAPLSQMMLQATQQHYDMERQYKIAGDLLPNSPTHIMIGPDNIAGFYDFVPVDGTMPTDKFALANLWKEIMTGMVQFPSLMQRYDVASVFEFTAQLAGAKNVRKFRIDLTPDGEITRRMQAGDIRPAIRQPGGGSSQPGATKAELGRPPSDGQLTGMGPTS